jgi:hypothetical protein
MLATAGPAFGKEPIRSDERETKAPLAYSLGTHTLGQKLPQEMVLARQATTGTRAWSNWWSAPDSLCLAITTMAGTVTLVERTPRAECSNAVADLSKIGDAASALVDQ